MIISVSGKIGHGKDLTGKIIQAFLEFPLASNENILRMALSGIDNPQSQIKKWADKLKDIVCILLNCTREQLEDRKFKEKELGEEWWYYKFGGDEYCRSAMIPYLEAQYEKGKEPFQYLVKLTPRLLLQLLGTDCGRNIIHPNIWVNALLSEYKPYIGNNMVNVEQGFTANHIYPNWIVTDTRFPNELQAVESRQGITINVIRLGVLTDSATGKSFSIKVHKKEHESETALNKSSFHYTIYNDGTIENLIEIVKEILKEQKLI